MQRCFIFGTGYRISFDDHTYVPDLHDALVPPSCSKAGAVALSSRAGTSLGKKDSLRHAAWKTSSSVV